MTSNQLPRLIAEPLLRTALGEDLGMAGDLTARLLDPKKTGKAFLRARQSGVLSGIEAAAITCNLVDMSITIDEKHPNGHALEKDDLVAVLEGPLASIFTAERTFLNIIQRMSGIATSTSDFVRATHATHCRILCTRKTTPGLRAWEKQAVRHGGGINHRFGLSDGVMLKDNHIAAHGSITVALAEARKIYGPMVKIEVECDHHDQVAEAVHAGADVIMFDNMNVEQVAKAVLMVNGRAATEASGNMTLEMVPKFAATGVDYISVGRLTHSSPSIDLGLDL
ncbi:MAG: carboxylating nicotinate-nucleotide diphosphorylase [SAR116 cluster bacterium]|nr:nicotinate-nucleotide diphosphorylase (carboxylating) [Paracoccaceae bacterium]MAW14529.1 nicotinate-nucleotide diphosphorylase (carboxylating) [Paracoccaceae bacterium]RCL80522.1 MAG: carboxylating nicotinate-nucleotide diphosphorylase [SAR116 cluster bacterium]HBQ23504.1 carboxylating nicotinate-nucleotide diphosphorylase [Alphaproteobacteria bacterium]|tara:strand:+ start:5323 stop:6165 length:843 start_codon:yes stop_codon:yes gene_type:complete